LALHHEVFVDDLHGNPPGVRVSVEALQQCLPRHRVKIASHQKPPDAQAVRCRIWKDQLIMDILRAVGFSQVRQGGFTVFGNMERERLANHVETTKAELKR
jgi:hypothetical protein